MSTTKISDERIREIKEAQAKERKTSNVHAMHMVAMATMKPEDKA